VNLPNSQSVVIEQEKLIGYLLNRAHPDNGGKAAFFLALGFTPEKWRVMAVALRHLADQFPVTNSIASVHGHKYVVDGQIEAPVGKTAKIRTIWIVDRGLENPRLVTAYPL